jgi:hypothetical protein
MIRLREKKIKKELDKCVILCATHHREVECNYIKIELED